MSLANTKRRMTVGTRVRLIQCRRGPVPAAMQTRIVAKVQSNSVAFTLPWHVDPAELSWLPWPTAKNFRLNSDGFTILEGGKTVARYVWVA